MICVYLLNKNYMKMLKYYDRSRLIFQDYYCYSLKIVFFFSVANFTINVDV